MISNTVTGLHDLNKLAGVFGARIASRANLGGGNLSARQFSDIFKQSVGHSGAAQIDWNVPVKGVSTTVVPNEPIKLPDGRVIPPPPAGSIVKSAVASAAGAVGRASVTGEFSAKSAHEAGTLAADTGLVRSSGLPAGTGAAPGASAVAGVRGTGAGAITGPTGRDLPVPADPIEVLKKALEDAGVSTIGMQFSYADDTVIYPGGSYQNKQVTVQTPNGRKEQYSADLMMRSPWVTVVEIQRLSRPA